MTAITEGTASRTNQDQILAFVLDQSSTELCNTLEPVLWVEILWLFTILFTFKCIPSQEDYNFKGQKLTKESLFPTATFMLIVSKYILKMSYSLICTWAKLYFNSYITVRKNQTLWKETSKTIEPISCK